MQIVCLCVCVCPIVLLAFQRDPKFMGFNYPLETGDNDIVLDRHPY